MDDSINWLSLLKAYAFPVLLAVFVLGVALLAGLLALKWVTLD
jgi:hypothetical protein